MAKQRSNIGIKVMSAVGVAATLGAAAFFWSGGESLWAEAAIKEASVEITKPLYHQMEPIVVNLSSGTSKTRYLKISPVLVTRNQSFFDQLTEFDPVVRNRLLAMYSMRSAEDLLRPSGFEDLRQESLNVLQEALKDETGTLTLSDVLFTEYVIQ